MMDGRISKLLEVRMKKRFDTRERQLEKAIDIRERLAALKTRLELRDPTDLPPTFERN